MKIFFLLIGLLPFFTASEITFEEPIPPELKSYSPTKEPDDYESSFYSSIIIIVVFAVIGLIISIFATVFCVKPAVQSLQKKKNQFRNLQFSSDESDMQDIH